MPSIITMSQLPKFTRIHALSGTAMLVRAGAGVGKTTFYRDWAHEQGPDYFYASLNASTAMLADIIGFLLPHDEVYDGRTIPVGKFTFPYFMRDERSGKPVFLFTKGLLVIDEVDKAGPAEKKALAILQEEGRLGEWRLPPGIQIVLLGNRQKDRSGSTKEFDFIINRRAEYELRPDMMSWIIWAQSHDITIETMAFANHNPDTIFGGDIPDEQGPWPTPRSTEKCDKWIRAAASEGIVIDPNARDNEGINLEWFTGVAAHVGVGMAAQMMAFRRLQFSLPRWSAIMKDPDNTPVPHDRPDACMLVAYQLAHRTDKTNLPTLARYIKRFPRSFAMSYWRVALSLDKSLMSTKTAVEWNIDNAALYEQVMS